MRIASAVFIASTLLVSSRLHAQADKSNPEPATAPARVINENHPIIVESVGLIGGSKNGAWVRLDDMPKTRQGKPVDEQYQGPPIVVDMPLVHGGESYRLYASQKALGEGTGSKVSYGVDGAGNAYHKVKVKPASKDARKWRFALNAEWDALPRPLVANKGGYTVDVDGDGKSETIRVHTKQNNTKQNSTKKDDTTPSAESGDEADNSKTVTFTLEMNGKKARLMQLTIDGTYSVGYTLDAIDLNGDGKLDFVFTTTGHNTSLQVVDVSRNKPEVVLGFEEGD